MDPRSHCWNPGSTLLLHKAEFLHIHVKNLAEPLQVKGRWLAFATLPASYRFHIKPRKLSVCMTKPTNLTDHIAL
jgi:hypothetical protein